MAINLCASSAQNTGVIACDKFPGIPSQFLIYNGAKLISGIGSDATFQAFLETSSQLSFTASEKVFVFPEILDVVDNTEQNTVGTLNQGYSTVLRVGRPSYTVKVKAGISTIAKLQSFNNTTVNLVVGDSGNNYWGKKSGNYFVGAPVTFYCAGLGFSDGQNVKEGIVEITVSYLSAADLNANAAYGHVTTSAAIVGLLDVPLVETTTHTTNVWKIGGSIPTAKVGVSINLHDFYTTELASAGLWTAYTGTTYQTSLAITSVANDATNGGWTVTFDSTAFTALASGTVIKLNLAAPPTLAAAGVTGIEGGYILLTK